MTKCRFRIRMMCVGAGLVGLAFVAPVSAQGSLISGTETGIDPITGILCANLTTGSQVKHTTTAPDWDCGALATSPGDTVRILVHGKSTGEPLTGTITGLDRVTGIFCGNSTTGERVTADIGIPLPEWGCSELSVSPEDRVRVLFRGTVP